MLTDLGNNVSRLSSKSAHPISVHWRVLPGPHRDDMYTNTILGASRHAKGKTTTKFVEGSANMALLRLSICASRGCYESACARHGVNVNLVGKGGDMGYCRQPCSGVRISGRGRWGISSRFWSSCSSACCRRYRPALNEVGIVVVHPLICVSDCQMPILSRHLRHQCGL
jgi:hypothetical protein